VGERSEREQRRLKKKLKHPTKNFKDLEELRKFLSNEIYNKVSQKNESLIEKYSRWKMKEQASQFDKYSSLQSAETLISNHERKTNQQERHRLYNVLPYIMEQQSRNSNISSNREQEANYHSMVISRGQNETVLLSSGPRQQQLTALNANQ
jgi:phosphorylcholine metabolism protein LicD